MVQLSPRKDPPRCEVSCQGVTNRLALSLRLCFVKASPTVKAALCYTADNLVALLPSCRSVQSSLAVREFMLQGKNAANKATDRCVQIWCCGAQSASEQSQLCELSGPTFKFTMQLFSMEGSCTEDLQKPQDCQNWGVCACPGQYGSTTTLGCTFLCQAKPSLKAEWYMSVMRMVTLSRTPYT